MILSDKQLTLVRGALAAYRYHLQEMYSCSGAELQSSYQEMERRRQVIVKLTDSEYYLRKQRQAVKLADSNQHIPSEETTYEEAKVYPRNI